MAAADAIQQSAFHAGTYSMGNVAVNVFPYIIVSIPALIRASEYGNAQVCVDFRGFIRHCQISGSMINALAIARAHIVALFLDAIPSGNPRQRL